MRSVLLVAVVVSVVGCAPVMGDPCEPDGSAVCDGKDAVLWCKGGAFKRYLCPGRCITTRTSPAFCDFTGARVGDPCPVEKIGYCASATQLVICTGGVFTAVACSSCTTAADTSTKCLP